MKSATVVIGAAWGDEGKGLLTDYHCSRHLNNGLKPLVVRFNGGAQAGHTVFAPDGRRHVFHHFGSGSFLGVPTYLSQYFIMNPFLWEMEYNELKKLGVYPRVFGDIRAFVTTPYDMMLNELKAKGLGVNDTCGAGINETVTRCLSHPEFKTTFNFTKNDMHTQLLIIKEKYWSMRVQELVNQFNLNPEVVEKYNNLAQNDGIMSNYLEAYEFMSKNTTKFNPNISFLDGFDLIFEGAQGLLLDEKHEFFPYVTRSRTGLDNVLSISKELGIDQLDVTYVMRSYMTRHGDGPFPTASNKMKYEDDTNIPNQYQGSLVFGSLDLNLISTAIKKDLAKAEHEKIKVNTTVAVTHLDQTGGGLMSDRLYHAPEIKSVITEKFGAKKGLKSFGPTRNTIYSM